MKSKLKAMVFVALAGLIGSAAISLGLAQTASAATKVVVTPANTQGWTTADTRPGGTVTYIADPDPQGGKASLRLKTDNTVAAKAQYLHAANTPLAKVTELSYYTKQVPPSPPLYADASYQVVTYLLGGTGGFTTLVFEPYENGAITPNGWQQWDVAKGQFWSTQTVTCPNGVIAAGHGGAPFYTLAQVKATCPAAQVIGFGVNIGSNNAGFDVRADLVDFNGTVYDFELVNLPTRERQCENGGYVNYTNDQGAAFTSEEQCQAFVERRQNGNDDKGNNNQGDQGGGNRND